MILDLLLLIVGLLIGLPLLACASFGIVVGLLLIGAAIKVTADEIIQGTAWGMKFIGCVLLAVGVLGMLPTIGETGKNMADQAFMSFLAIFVGGMFLAASSQKEAEQNLLDHEEPICGHM